VDGLLAFGLFFLLGMLIANRYGGTTGQGFELTGLPALLLLGAGGGIMLAYCILAEALFGRTLGKLVAETRVTADGGAPPGLRAAVVRNLMRLVDGLGGYVVAAFSVILTHRRVRLGDLAAGTVVVQRETGRATRAAALLVALALGAGGVVGGLSLGDAATPGPATSPGTGERVVAALASDATPSHQPIEPTTVFAPDAPTVTVTFTTRNVTPGSRLKAVWTAVDVGTAVPPNSELDQVVLVLPGAAPGSFRLRRGAGPWPTGEYRVDLYLDDELVATLPYRVSP